MNGLLEDPLAQFQLWYREAEAANPAPEAAALATATPDGRPSVRMVLVKRVDELGFGFHTNLESRKGLELAANPRAALLFHWRGGPGRQVRVEGGVERVPGAEAEEYFRTRPHGSRLAAWASPQSRPIADRAELERRYREAEERFAGGEIPLPPHWGGFRLVADAYEFRLHDRVRYERDGEGWRATRLAP
jgi:pyridoxamine 5'-phosphate oxidase